MARKKSEKNNSTIVVENLKKTYGKFIAVDEISLEVMQGEIFSLLGPNGAGKSTTIKMLITLLTTSTGGGKVAGKNFVTDTLDVRRSIGYVPQLISVDGTLTAYENLMLMARLYDIPRNKRKKRIEEVLCFLKLEKVQHNLVRNFSGGMVRKLEIGQAILHDPKVLFLDEPTSGLDPSAKNNVWKHLLHLRQKNKMTIFFTTHNMEEAEEVSDRIAIMNSGKIVVTGTVDELKEKAANGHCEKKSLEEAFIFFTGNSLEKTFKQSFRQLKDERKNEMQLG